MILSGLLLRTSSSCERLQGEGQIRGDWRVKDLYAPCHPSVSAHNLIPSDVTGPSSATSAIFIVYDIFGYSPQVLQGADILAHADDEHHQYQVYIPDFFEGKPADHSWYPPDTKEKGEKLGAFFQGPAAPPKNAEKVPELVTAIKKYSPKIEKLGVLGMCWGGKVGFLARSMGANMLRPTFRLDCIPNVSIRDSIQRSS